MPKLLSYAISGLFGCASKVWFIQTGLRFVIWSVIKFFVVLSGVVASLVLVGPDSFHRMPENFGISFAFFAIALALLFLYRLTEQTLAWCFARCPRMIQKSLLRIDVWATRFRT